MNYTKTRSAQVAIGEDDLDGIKGVHHSNAVDEVPQWTKSRSGRVAGAVAAISQKHLEPVLRAILSQFPFPSIPTTGLNSSMIRRRGCSSGC